MIWAKMVLGPVEVAEDATDMVMGSFAFLLAISHCWWRIQSNAYFQAVFVWALLFLTLSLSEAAPIF